MRLETEIFLRGEFLRGELVREWLVNNIMESPSCRSLWLLTMDSTWVVTTLPLLRLAIWFLVAVKGSSIETRWLGVGY